MNRLHLRTAIGAGICLAATLAGFLLPQGAWRAASGYGGVAPGFKLEQIAGRLTAPVAVAADDHGVLYVAEAGGKTGTPPRVLRVQPGQTGHKTVAADFRAPLTGLAWQGKQLLVSYAGGVDLLDPATGVHHPLIKGLPTGGDYANNQVAIGPDGSLMFGIGAATNAGVVGADNVERGWVGQSPGAHDIPCRPVKLRGLNFTSPNPLTPDAHDTAATGAFMPFGKTTARLQVVPGAMPCTGAVLFTRPDGTNLSMYAWGLRNPFGLAFAPDGAMYATVQGYESRGSRPVIEDRDYLYRIDPDRWYGWPDYAGGRSLTSEEFQKPGFPLSPVLAEAPEQPPPPVATFAPHSGAAGLIFPPSAFGLGGDALVALTGQGDFGSGEPRGAVVRVNLGTGAVTPLAQAVGHGAKGLHHPRGLAAAPSGGVLVVDLGEIRQQAAGAEPVPGTGALWLLRHTAPAPPSAWLGMVQWQWALVGLVLSVSGTHLLRQP